MKRTYPFVKRVGTVKYAVSKVEEIEIPVFPGILKHLREHDLPKVAESPAALRKYTREVLKSALWPVLRSSRAPKCSPAWVRWRFGRAASAPWSFFCPNTPDRKPALLLDGMSRVGVLPKTLQGDSGETTIRGEHS